MVMANILTCFLMIMQLVLGVVSINYEKEILEFFPGMLSSGGLLAVNQLFSVLLPVIVFMLFVRRGDSEGYVGAGEFLRLRPISGENILLIAGMCVFVQPLMALLSLASQLFFSNNVGVVAAEMIETLPYLRMMALFALLPSVFEELALRGAVLGAYRELDERRAILINGLFFGLVHLDGQQLPYAIALGAFFSYIVIRTGSLFAGIVAHFTINASQVTLVYYLAQTIEQYFPDEGVYETANTEAADVGLAYGAFALLLAFIIFLGIVTVSYIMFFKLLRRFSANNPPNRFEYDGFPEHDCAGECGDDFEVQEISRLTAALGNRKTTAFYLSFSAVVAVYLTIMVFAGCNLAQIMFLSGILASFFFVLFFLRIRS